MTGDSVRCDDHVGLEHPPRCYKCDAERRDQEGTPKSKAAGASDSDRF